MHPLLGVHQEAKKEKEKEKPEAKKKEASLPGWGKQGIERQVPNNAGPKNANRLSSYWRVVYIHTCAEVGSG